MGEESMTICSAVLIHQRVTDGQTDGQTDVQPIAKTCFSIADARKTVLHANNYSLEAANAAQRRFPLRLMHALLAVCS